MPGSSLSIRDPWRIREGVPVQLYDEIKHVLNLSDQQAAPLLHLSPRTLGRRRAEGRFEPDESDRLARLGRLLQLALETFDGDEESLRVWFKNPHALLHDETPLAHADTEVGARAVEDLLNALRYGFAT